MELSLHIANHLVIPKVTMDIITESNQLVDSDHFHYTVDLKLFYGVRTKFRTRARHPRIEMEI